MKEDQMLEKANEDIIRLLKNENKLLMDVIDLLIKNIKDDNISKKDLKIISAPFEILVDLKDV